MPLKLNVGLAQKVGQPGYSSLSASCHVEVELESSLIQSDLDAFQRHVKNAFNACRQSVHDELTRQQSAGAAPAAASTTHHHAPTDNGHSNDRASNGNGHGSNGHGQTSHRASQKQIDFANQLAKGIRGLGVRRLESLADKMFHKPLADLSTLDASGLIDTLKAIKEDRISLEDALNSVAV